MSRPLNRSRHGGRLTRDEGFTLIELMVVLLIIAILVAVGIPSLLAARRRAQDRAAMAMVRQALSVQMVFYGSGQGFSDDNAIGGELDSIGPDVAWGTLDAKDKGVIATVTGADDNVTILRSRSSGGNVYCIGRIEETSSAGTYYTLNCDGTETEAAIGGWPSTTSVGWP